MFISRQNWSVLYCCKANIAKHDVTQVWTIVLSLFINSLWVFLLRLYSWYWIPTPKPNISICYMDAYQSSGQFWPLPDNEDTQQEICTRLWWGFSSRLISAYYDKISWFFMISIDNHSNHKPYALILIDSRKRFILLFTLSFIHDSTCSYNI